MGYSSTDDEERKNIVLVIDAFEQYSTFPQPRSVYISMLCIPVQNANRPTRNSGKHPHAHVDTDVEQWSASFNNKFQPLYLLDRCREAAEGADFSAALVIVNDTGVNGGGAGVLLREGAALRLCAMCALTRWPAASALQSESSPARTAAPMMRARRRAFSPGSVGCEPLTPSMSSMALWGSRMVPPPRVPTSRDGIETAICREPWRLGRVSKSRSMNKKR